MMPPVPGASFFYGYGLQAEEAEVHIIYIAAPVDAAGETVLGEDLLNLAVHRDGIGVVFRIKALADHHRSVGSYVGVLVRIYVDGGSGVVLRIAAVRPVGDNGVDGAFLLTGVDLLENLLDSQLQILVNIESEFFVIFSEPIPFLKSQTFTVTCT